MNSMNVVSIVVGVIDLFVVGLFIVGNMRWTPVVYACAGLGILCLILGLTGKG